jgi:hypothetical protein
MSELAAPTAKAASPGALIFESYGWSDASEIARQLKASLEDAGFEVWLDSDHIKPDAVDFWTPLQTALDRCKLVVALLSPHSVRLEGDIASAGTISVCHNELILAVRMKKAVVSVTVIDCQPPLSINQYDPIDLTGWRESPDLYRKGVDEIVHWIREGLADRRRYRIHVDNLSRDRLSFPEEQIASLGFVGRDWLIGRLQTRLAGAGKCFLIAAEPGAGKTAFAAELVRRNPGDRILAYHFCNAQREETLDPRRFVRSLAAMLCGTVPAYRTLLRSSEDLVRALKSEAQPATMLWEAVLEPLRRIDMDAPRIILVDGLDEAIDRSAAAAETIPGLLSQALANFPDWLKLIATTRPHDRVLAMFQAGEQFALGDDEAQLRDVRKYVDWRLSGPRLAAALEGLAVPRDQLADALAERSAGNFQYVEMVLDELAAGTLAGAAIGGLPRSLAGLYYNRAEARFPDGAGFAEVRPILSVFLAARRSLSRSELARITGLDREEALPMLRKLGGFVTWDHEAGEEGVYRIAHKSIGDWLVAPPARFDRFKVDPARGRELLLGYCRGWRSRPDSYALLNLIPHLVESGLAAEALATVREGFFAARRGEIDPAADYDDARVLTVALVEAGDQAGIVELAKTDNIRQRDGVAAALQIAPPASEAFVAQVVNALMKVG